MEIMLALLILGAAFLPIIAVIGTSTKDTDVANSAVFAQTTARNILDTLLDDVPFNSIQPNPGNSNIAKLVDFKNDKIDYKIDSFKEMLGTKDDNATGKLIDDRGIEYTTYIYVFPIEITSNEDPDLSKELTFTYLPLPDLATGTEWFRYGSGRDNDCYISSEYPHDPYKKLDSKDDLKTVGAYALGARPNHNITECYIMKKILFKITWTGSDKKERSFEIYTMKANLDSEKSL